jgi:hypothetical protein
MGTLSAGCDQHVDASAKSIDQSTKFNCRGNPQIIRES